MAPSEFSEDSFSEQSEDERLLASSSNIAVVLEKVDLLWKPSPIPEHAKKGDYKKAIKDSNNQVQKLTAAIKELILEDSRLRKKIESQKDGSALEKSVSEPRGRDHQFPEEFRKFCNSIRLEAKRFGFLYEMYLESNSIPFEFISPDERIEPTNLARYSDEKLRKAAVATELYESMPTVLHPVMSMHPDDFSNLFIKSLNENRKILVSRARMQSHRIFPELEAIPRNNRMNNQEARAAIYGPNDKRVKFAPVLFPHRDTAQLQSIFMAPELPKLMRVLILAPSSLNQDKKAPSRQTFGELWRVREVSAGSIAFVAVLAIHLFSGDKQFRETGPDTSIPYRALFNSYKQILLGRLANGRHTVFNWYNKQVFKGRSQEESVDAEHFSGLEDAIDADYSDDGSDMDEPRPTVTRERVSHPAVPVAANPVAPGITTQAATHDHDAADNSLPSETTDEQGENTVVPHVTGAAVVDHGPTGNALQNEATDEQERTPQPQASRSRRRDVQPTATRRSKRRGR